MNTFFYWLSFFLKISWWSNEMLWLLTWFLKMHVGHNKQIIIGSLTCSRFFPLVNDSAPLYFFLYIFLLVFAFTKITFQIFNLLELLFIYVCYLFQLPFIIFLLNLIMTVLINFSSFAIPICLQRFYVYQIICSVLNNIFQSYYSSWYVHVDFVSYLFSARLSQMPPSYHIIK